MQGCQHYKYYNGGGQSRNAGDLSYIVGCMRFSGYLRQARYGMTATHSGSKLYWHSRLTFCGLTMLNSSQSIQRASILVKHNTNNSIGVIEMQEIVEILRLLSKAIEQNTINTYQEQGAVAADWEGKNFAKTIDFLRDLWYNIGVENRSRCLLQII